MATKHDNLRLKVKRRKAYRTLKRRTLKILDWLSNLFLAAVGLAVLWFVVQLLGYASFTIPTDSMRPTLIPGDLIIVDKTVMGARLFDFFDALGGEQVEIRRTWRRGNARRGDVLVFNFPYTASWDSIAMDIRKYFVKRCAALPGDTVELRDCEYYINGERDSQLNNESSKLLLEFIRNNENNSDAIARSVVLMAFPNDSIVPWTICDFGPLVVPAKGTKIKLNHITANIYRNFIEWESGEKLCVEGDSVRLDDKFLPSYTFKENYYFVAGDNVFNSEDSRYFGLLPEPFIVGKATFILQSTDRRSGKKRSDRYFKRL